MPQQTDEQLQRIAASLQDLICILTETQGWLQGFRAAREGGAS